MSCTQIFGVQLAWSNECHAKFEENSKKSPNLEFYRSLEMQVGLVPGSQWYCYRGYRCYHDVRRYGNCIWIHIVEQCRVKI